MNENKEVKSRERVKKIRLFEKKKEEEKRWIAVSKITILIYYNGYVTQNTNEDVIFMSNEQAYFTILQTISFEELNVGLCESINVSTEKRMVKIRCRCLISIVNRNIKYWVVRISSKQGCLSDV